MSRQTLFLVFYRESDRKSCDTSDNVHQVLQNRRYCFDLYRHNVFDITFTDSCQYQHQIADINNITL